MHIEPQFRRSDRSGKSTRTTADNGNPLFHIKSVFELNFGLIGQNSSDDSG
jgi:hypothetical protein